MDVWVMFIDWMFKDKLKYTKPRRHLSIEDIYNMNLVDKYSSKVVVFHSFENIKIVRRICCTIDIKNSQSVELVRIVSFLDCGIYTKQWRASRQFTSIRIIGDFRKQRETLGYTILSTFDYTNSGVISRIAYDELGDDTLLIRLPNHNRIYLCNTGGKMTTGLKGTVTARWKGYKRGRVLIETSVSPPTKNKYYNELRMQYPNIVIQTSTALLYNPCYQKEKARKAERDIIYGTD